jgi:hypothetical protein
MESFVAIDKKKTESIRWQNIAYDNALKPPLGMALESALLTTYSAEMPAIVAALRAMGGFAEGEGKLGPRGLAHRIGMVEASWCTDFPIGASYGQRIPELR